jgi:metallo-beta-lactamase class B
LEVTVKSCAIGLLSALGLAVVLGDASVIGQSGRDTIEERVAAAKAAAGQEYTTLFNDLCAPPAPSPTPQPSQAPTAQPQGRPDRSEWHAEPVKVFDNLYFVGQSEHSTPGAPAAWAVTTSDGIILIDTLFDYSVEDEVVGGLKKLGLDPAKIKFAIVSHGHFDHSGGANYLQDHFGTRVILSAADWDWLDGNPRSQTKPKRDMLATDGQKLTLGDTTLMLYITPGHTPGTISTLIPVKDHGRPHIAAVWGGTGFNWIGIPGTPATPATRARYITPDRPDRFWFETYSNSAERFRDIVAKVGADVLLANHSILDGSWTKLPELAKRKPGDPHPYVVGNDSVKRYLTVVDECAKAGLLRLK